MYETDTINTTSGDLKITFIGHGSLMCQFNDLITQTSEDVFLFE